MKKLKKVDLQKNVKVLEIIQMKNLVGGSTLVGCEHNTLCLSQSCLKSSGVRGKCSTSNGRCTCV